MMLLRSIALLLCRRGVPKK